MNIDNIQLLHLQVADTKITTSDEFKYSDVEVAYVDYGNSATYGFVEEENLVNLALSLTLDGYDENDKEAGTHAAFRIEFLFEVDDLEAHLKNDTDGKVLSSQLVLTLAGIAYSTARGLVYDRLQGSAMENSLLPVIEASEIFEEE